GLHALLESPADGRVQAALALLRGFLVALLLLHVGEDSGLLAGLGEPAQGLFEGLPGTHDDACHVVFTSFRRVQVTARRTRRGDANVCSRGRGRQEISCAIPNSSMGKGVKSREFRRLNPRRKATASVPEGSPKE